MSYRSILFSSLIALLSTCFNVQADDVSDQRITLGLKLLGAGWEGDNADGKKSFKSDKGGQFGANASYQLNRFYTGLNIQSGDYQFDGVAPDQFTVIGRLPTNNQTIKQTDLDLLVGYYFWSQVSLFLDIKGVVNDWQANTYSQTYVGLGLGISGFIPLDKNWTVFGSAGIIGKGDINDQDDNKVGEGTSGAIEFGAVYSINEDNYFNTGLKFRRYNFDYIDGSSQDYTISAIFVGYSHSFSF